MSKLDKVILSLQKIKSKNLEQNQKKISKLFDKSL